MFLFNITWSINYKVMNWISRKMVIVGIIYKMKHLSGLIFSFLLFCFIYVSICCFRVKLIDLQFSDLLRLSPTATSSNVHQEIRQKYFYHKQNWDVQPQEFFFILNSIGNKIFSTMVSCYLTDEIIY